MWTGIGHDESLQKVFRDEFLNSVKGLVEFDVRFVDMSDSRVSWDVSC